MGAAQGRGHDVQVVVSDYRGPGVTQRDELPVDRSLHSYLDATAQRAVPLSPPQRLRLERANAAVLDGHLRTFSPDVVSWWAMGGMSLSLIERVRRRGLPSVLTIQDSWPLYGPMTDGWTRMGKRLQPVAPVLEPLGGIPIRYDLERAGLYLLNSRYTSAALAAGGFEPARSVVISPGVQGRFLHSAPAEPWGWRLLYVGRVHRDKGVDIAVAGLADLPAVATLTIAGAGDDRYQAELRRQAALLGVQDRVLFAGPARRRCCPRCTRRRTSCCSRFAGSSRGGSCRWRRWVWDGRCRDGSGRSRQLPSRRGQRSAHSSEDPQALAAAVVRLAGDEPLRARLRGGGRAPPTTQRLALRASRGG